ncbi:hypothetical protein N781_05290 [Pontibacillus halophilus JSM 076056 = DSM 19796]|uniref:Type VII secretion protein EssB n=1 Tax=Pontibacillus halophilus JSM 076056 = DSM 19796 TaxID=1385510 RepID=A0A0A5GD23_9BACI|nr:type VII secretion protein EssB [Pontibacillus halophilus]KGX91111.1 hypothetical protein N781_05290 [Pontibacillus halophilus JSM 076056 = DSM 19796]
MSQDERTYLEEQLEAEIHEEASVITFQFQQEKVKMDELEEVHVLRDLHPHIKKTIKMGEDDVSIEHVVPQSYVRFQHVLKEGEKERAMSAYRLVKEVEGHSIRRLHPIVSPENMVFDRGLKPYLLHYGVKESLPPYERDNEQLLYETRALVAALVAPAYSFIQYLRFYETLKLSDLAQKVVEAKTFQQLIEILENRIEDLRQQESSYIQVTHKKWKTNRFALLGVSIILLPVMVYSIYSLFFLQPKQDQIVAAQESFLKDEYSEVVTALQPYPIERIPKVSQYELAVSYITNESLTEDQKETVMNSVSLQSDPDYYEYWIQIGRGQAEEALEVARFLEDRDLIMFGLLKYREQVKANRDLSSEERKQELDEIERELKDYEEEREEQEENEGTNS